MSASRKKVIVRRFAGDVLHGYLPSGGFLDRGGAAGGGAEVSLLDLAGRMVPLPLSEIKMISYVRDFNLDDAVNPERIMRSAFLARPRSEGLWLRLTFTAGDLLEGLGPLDVTLLDGMQEDAGLFLTPPDDRTNTHRIFVPRTSIASLQVLAVVTTPSRKPARATAEREPDLFSGLDP